MNKQTGTILIILGVIGIVAVAALAFRNPTISEPTLTPEEQAMQQTPEEQNDMNAQMDVVENGSYAVDPDQSTVNWEGRKTLIANYKDTGTLRVASGNFTVENDLVTEGTITFDMTSLKAESTSGPGDVAKLESHLKTADFFDVENHSTATFTVTRAEPGAGEGALTVHGDLTIKGITHPIAIPVQLGSVNGRAVAAGSVEVDRTKYDVRYGSDQFFDNLANNVIDDSFTLRFTLVANAQ